MRQRVPQLKSWSTVTVTLVSAPGTVSVLATPAACFREMHYLCGAGNGLPSPPHLIFRLQSELLPVLAAKLLDPAGKHKLVAVQEALREFRKHVLLPATSIMTSGATSADAQQTAALPAASKATALDVALAASKSGLCDRLCWHLDAVCRQDAKHTLPGDRRGHARGLNPLSSGLAAQPSKPNADAGSLTAGSSLPLQPAATQHQLAQLLLVYQWTAALCRIWPSSIPDAKGLHSLLSSALKGAAQLMSQLPHMQAGTNAHAVSCGAASGVPSVPSSSSTAAKNTEQSALLAGPVAVAVLEVAALVLEPLGLVLHQQQMAEQQYKQPPSLSASAQALCGVLSGNAIPLLQALLTACLHQLVLHAECKRESFTQQCADSSMQQESAACSAATVCGAATDSSSTSDSAMLLLASKSIAELAEGYLLQHADTLQAKQPLASPSRAAVVAWKAVCKRQWADLALPLTLQEAAAVLASTQPSAAAASSSGVVGAAGTAAAAVWAMQDCGALMGQFGGSSQSVDTSGLRGPSSSSGSTGNTSICTSSRTSLCGCSGSAHGLPAALASKPVLTIASCTHTAAALSAVCRHVAKTAGSSTSSSTCSLACTLLATAAAAVSLQGAAAMPLVSAAVAAASALITDKPSAQQSPELSTTERQGGSAAASGSPAPGGRTESHAAAAMLAAGGMEAATGAAGAAAAGPASDGWLRCLSLAGGLTKAVLQLEGEATPAEAVQPAAATPVSFQCAQLLVVLLQHLAAQAYSAGTETDTAMQLKQLQRVAYALQLVEAAVRRHEVSLAAKPEVLTALQQDHLWENACFAIGYPAAEAAVSLAVPYGIVLGSVQGQQLLQSCTSLLLTYNSLLLSSGYSIDPISSRLCAQLLQMLQRSEAMAASGSSCGISQSLAAGLLFVGRCLLSLASAVTPPGAGDSSSSSSTSSPEHQGIKLRAQLRAWLSIMATGTVVQAGDPIDSKLSDALRVQADMLQQTVRGTVTCLESISQSLQQRAGQVVIAAPTDGITSMLAAAEQLLACSSDPTLQAGSSLLMKALSAMGSSGSTSSSHEGSRHAVAGSTGDAAQHYGGNQQQQAPADWLLAGVHTAHTALQKVLLPLNAALTPYLVGMDPLSIPVNPHALPLPTLLVAAGEALCAAVPSSSCCSNPRCTNLSGVSAGFALVRGKGCVCGGCLGLQAGGSTAAPRQGVLQQVVAARYCSRACHAADRQQHQGLCKKLAQAAAAAEPRDS